MSGRSGRGTTIPIRFGRAWLVHTYLAGLKPEKMHHYLTKTQYRYGSIQDHATVCSVGIFKKALVLSGLAEHINKLEKLAGNKRLDN